MFSFRRDKTGFFSAIVLIVITVAAAVSTFVLWVVGLWDRFDWIFKIIWAAWWVLCIVTVLVRLAIFRYQMLKAQRQAAQNSGRIVQNGAAPPANSQNGDTPFRPTSSEPTLPEGQR